MKYRNAIEGTQVS